MILALKFFLLKLGLALVGGMVILALL